MRRGASGAFTSARTAMARRWWSRLPSRMTLQRSFFRTSCTLIANCTAPCLTSTGAAGRPSLDLAGSLISPASRRRCRVSRSASHVLVLRLRNQPAHAVHGAWCKKVLRDSTFCPCCAFIRSFHQLISPGLPHPARIAIDLAPPYRRSSSRGREVRLSTTTSRQKTRPSSSTRSVQLFRI